MGASRRARVAASARARERRMATKAKKKSVKTKSSKPKAAAKRSVNTNPYTTSGEGADPVRAYIQGMPGWKRAVGQKLDALIARTVPKSKKAVRVNSPFYGTAKLGWFLSYHCYPKQVRITFFNGKSLTPLPPGASKVPGVRYLDIFEGDEVVTPQLTKWIKASASLTGWDGESDLC